MTDRALMEQRAAHRHGLRYVRVGDVFVDPSAPAKGEAVVIKVERPLQRGSHASTRAGKACSILSPAHQRPSMRTESGPRGSATNCGAGRASARRWSRR